MGSKSSKPLVSNANSVRLEIASQEYYTGGEAITGEVLLDVGTAGFTLHTLTISLGCTSRLWTSLCQPPTVHTPYTDVSSAYGPRSLDAGCHRFSFTLSTPDDARTYPPTIGEDSGLPCGYGIEWSVTARLNATICHATNLESQYIFRSQSLPVRIYPAAARDPQSTSAPEVFSAVSTSPYLRMTLYYSNEIPQAPAPCCVNLKIEPLKPVFVYTIGIYVKKAMVVWSPQSADVVFTKLPIGPRVVVKQVLASELKLDAQALGWGLRCIQPPAFVSAQASVSYCLCVDVEARDGRSESLQCANIWMAPVVPLEPRKDERGDY